MLMPDPDAALDGNSSATLPAVPNHTQPERADHTR